MSKPNEALTYQRAVDVLAYDPDTGILRWRDKRKDALSRFDAGCLVKGKYKRIRIDGVDYQAHRVAWLLAHKSWPQHDIDHINGLHSDNRLSNLRDVPRRTNAENQRVGRRGGLLGTAFHPHSGKWRAIICVNYKHRTLGYFATQEDAHAAYLAAKRQLHSGCTI